MGDRLQKAELEDVTISWFGDDKTKEISIDWGKWTGSRLHTMRHVITKRDPSADILQIEKSSFSVLEGEVPIEELVQGYLDYEGAARNAARKLINEHKGNGIE